MRASRVSRAVLRYPGRCTAAFSSQTSAPIGLIGLGKMGAAMAANFVEAGHSLVVYDAMPEAVAHVLKLDNVTAASSPGEVCTQASTVISMLPNDTVLRKVTLDETHGILANLQPGGVHVSCSTVSPHTSRELAALHEAQGCRYAGAPVFARPDGVACKNGSWLLSGDPAACEVAKPILETTCSGVFEFGEDPGAGNVVKLCGNFMIACAIEAIGESLTLAEKNGVDRELVMQMLSSTIFDCLIYKGYGNRVAGRKHLQDVERPGFALELGLKDVTLVLDTAHKSGTAMPFGSVLHDRLLSSLAKGRGDLDWSSIGLAISEDAGIDVDDFVKNPRPE